MDEEHVINALIILFVTFAPKHIFTGTGSVVNALFCLNFLPYLSEFLTSILLPIDCLKTAVRVAYCEDPDHNVAFCKSVTIYNPCHAD